MAVGVRVGKAGLAATGLMGWSTGLRGVTLLTHTTIGPAFLAMFAVSALLVGRRFDWGGKAPVARKALFGFSLAAALLCGGSILAAMTRFAGYSDQISLNAVHSWSGLALAVTGGVSLAWLVLRPSRD